MKSAQNSSLILILGDSLTVLLMILLGFAFHQTDVAERIQFTFLPFLAAWLVVAAAFRISAPQAVHWSQLWRVPLTMLVAAPLAGFLRSAWLGIPLVPIFVLVLGLALCLGLLAWRMFYILFMTRQAKA